MDDNEYMRRVRGLEGRLYRVAQAMLWRDADALDAVQEAVFTGWMKRSGLRDEARFEAWLMRILVNRCRDMLRGRKREAALTVEPTAEDRMCEDLQLRLALKKLPEKYRLPLVLHYMEGWPMAEVAELLRVPKPLAASRLRQARKALRALLDGGDER